MINKNASTEEKTELDDLYKQFVMVTTSSNFEGYTIKEYKDLVFGEITVPNGLLGAITSGTFFTCEALHKARTQAIALMREDAIKKGANAIIAVDIDQNNLNGNGVMVSANGTAVVIEKNKT